MSPYALQRKSLRRFARARRTNQFRNAGSLSLVGKRGMWYSHRSKASRFLGARSFGGGSSVLLKLNDVVGGRFCDV